MKDLQEIFNRMQEHKKKLKEMKVGVKDAFANSLEFQKVKEELDLAKDKKKSVEAQIRAELPSEMERIEDLLADIAADQELLNDVALTQISKGEPIQITDAKQQSYEPVFSVKFRKIK